MNLSKVFSVAAALALVCCASLAFAQPGPPGPPLPTAVPVDGGLSLLAAMGGAFAVRSLRRK